MVEKVVNAKANTSLQPPFGTKKIDFKYPKGYRPSVKKDKEYNINWEYQDKDKNKTKSHNSSSTNS